MILLLAGLAQATPIVTLGSTSQDWDTSITAGKISSPTHSTVARKTAATDTHASMGSAYRLDWNACTFTGSCYETTKVPEPESLVLMGTGLLSIAGLVRRRLLRP